ncbi:MAG: glycosyltransferase [Gammaproteobacteria bacterium]|nr:glycosyltransferase [Gammaproteobacteria bacterium]
MNDGKPVISVVVATHNRSVYAISAIRGILAIKSNDLQLVVHDSSDDGKLAAAVSEFAADNRFVYRHSETRLSMTDNYCQALDLATADYVCVIGDDDGVSSAIVELAHWAKRHQVDAVVPKISANYAWPDFRTARLGNRHASRMYVIDYSGQWRWIDSKAAVTRSFGDATQGTEGLTKLYHGIIARDVLIRIKAETGSYLHGVSPDISGALSIGLRVDRFVEIDFPFSLPGAAGGSNTGRSAMGTHKGKLEDDPHIKPYRNLVWPDEIPRFFSVETVWAQAGYATLLANNISPEKMNLARLYGLCLVTHGSYAGEIYKSIKSCSQGRNTSLVLMLIQVARYSIESLALKIFALARRLMKPSVSAGRFFVSDIPDIQAAMSRLEEIIVERGIGWDDNLKD